MHPKTLVYEMFGVTRGYMYGLLGGTRGYMYELFGGTRRYMCGLFGVTWGMCGMWPAAPQGTSGMRSEPPSGVRPIYCSQCHGLATEVATRALTCGHIF